MNQRVREIAEDIRELKIQGAINIALAAEEAMKWVVENSTAETKKDFIKELKDAGKILKGTRPTAVALPNAIDEFLKKVQESSKDMPELKEETLKITKKLISETKKATSTISKLGAGLVKNKMTVLTHCHSSTVTSILEQAWKSGTGFEVICTETRPWHQGFITAKELSEFGIPTTLIVDSAVMSFMEKVDLVLVGADTITANGDVVNKIGTSQVALIARNFKVPVYVAAQTLKFDLRRGSGEEVPIEERDLSEIIDPKRIPKASIRNPVFDVTTADYVTGVVTEKGIIKI